MDETQMEELKRALAVIAENIAATVEGIKDTVAAIAALGEEAEHIPPTKKPPRPPKRTGPVNKANYTANRPPRVARSSCRSIKR